MKNYFKSKKRIIPFSAVICVEIEEEYLSVIYGTGDSDIDDMPRFQLKDYEKWLGWKQVELEMNCKSNLANLLVETKSSNEVKPNNLTKEQVSKIVRMGYEPECMNCEISAKDDDDCQCRRDFVATDKFVEEVNQYLSCKE